MSIINFSYASSDNLAMREMSSDDSDDNDDVQEERRTYDLKRLRHFLLTANAEQLAAKREKQDFYKRELIHEYLRSLSDSNPDRLQEVRKRFKTYCNSYEDLMNSNWAACG
ncbi:unnamed protein product [Adineta ricciae]|uniref:Uncharacterized protein n=1 Tax=Adineta ricciae TaxID=249248 RepID=A0A815MBM7_ADIRI|nr:unnamed protein product [Adineta ricciae]CAF1595887.1 unnamed protein product [Adineta ricciae]